MISTGDVQQTIEFSAKDEIGDLADAFKELISYMKELSDIAHNIGEGNLNVTIVKRSENDILANAFENMLANLNTIMFELKHSVFSLNSATTEILATTTQVASSASQTSSAVAQTSASIEEIKQTAKASSAKAVQTTESTNKAMEIAKSGTQGLIENMQGLVQIKEKMDLIASNIILLSQQSQQIGEITSTVEDIANQSNMLAVNASIEAVKAGEQGKGFSVVAIELKNLSEQSKQGAKQVQKILADIQKVTGTLVMVAEQGAKAVESGVKQAQSAKVSMDQLNITVQGAANAGKQISASYEQELAGMDQISDAMSSVKEATHQNLSSIKQVEISAHDLNGLSQKLKEVMEHYTITDEK
jgi:methyl-accepting chemotaxis protein